MGERFHRETPLTDQGLQEAFLFFLALTSSIMGWRSSSAMSEIVSIFASKGKHMLSGQFRKKQLELAPFIGTLQALPTAGRLRVWFKAIPHNSLAA